MPTFPTSRAGPPVLWALFGMKGRVSRQVYWLSYLFVICLQSALLAQIVGGEHASWHRPATGVGTIFLALSLFSTFAVSVKRLHDVGYAGMLALAILVPFVNLAFAIWLGIAPGSPGPNRYGSAPDAPA